MTSSSYGGRGSPNNDFGGEGSLALDDVTCYHHFLEQNL